ncbi:MAG: RluA family pseudouridine synthase [Actinobacteria bacterium]|nr:RluA family pseudouridine synthase [Actinomycetota bacterium]
MNAEVKITVPREREGERLDLVLSAAPEVGSRAAAQKLIAGGHVRVNGKNQGKSYRVSAGEQVDARLPAAPELVAESMDLKVIFEDEYLLVVDKPAGVVTHPAKGHDSGTLVHGLLGHQIAGGDHPRRPGIVHRLDKDTSGLLIVARDDETHRRLTGMLASHDIDRTYLALVHGRFETATGTVDAPIARDSASRQRMAVARGRGRAAITHFEVLRSWSGAPGKPEGAGSSSVRDGFSLLRVKLETGRTHQIRVHLAAIGHPVAGDKLYGRRDKLAVGRQFLHSARLVFRHPRTGEIIDVSSPLPGDLAKVLDNLEKP